VISSTEALALDRVPRRLLVVGAGYIGLELGTAFRKMGSEVTVVEARERILPNWDAPLTNPVRRWLERAGVAVHLSARIEVVARAELAEAVVHTAEGVAARVAADKVLVTVGRRPRAQGWGLETMAVNMDGPFLRVDERCRTSMRDVWAIGDLVGEPMLAHKASAQGEMVAELIAGARRHFDFARYERAIGINGDMGDLADGGFGAAFVGGFFFGSFARGQHHGDAAQAHRETGEHDQKTFLHSFLP